MKVSKTQLVLLVFAMIMLSQASPIFARQDAGVSCFGAYEQFTNRSWQKHEVCIQETQNMPWHQKLGVRTLCKANWLSDAFQAEGEYVSCMSGFTAIFT